MDLYQFRDELLRYAERSPYPDMVIQVVDGSEWSRKPRAERIGIYRAALKSGEARWGRGSVMVRLNAITGAAGEGLGELSADLDLAFDALPPEQRSRVDMKVTRAVMELSSGAESPDSVAPIAVERIERLDDESFRDRMNLDDGFRRAVLQIASVVCRGRDSSLCERFGGVWRRQVELSSQTQSKDERRPEGSTSSDISKKWMADLWPRAVTEWPAGVLSFYYGAVADFPRTGPQRREEPPRASTARRQRAPWDRERPRRLRGPG